MTLSEIRLWPNANNDEGYLGHAGNHGEGSTARAVSPDDHVPAWGSSLASIRRHQSFSNTRPKPAKNQKFDPKFGSFGSGSNNFVK